MEMGIVGLGRMGGNMARRLLKKGHRMIVYDRSGDTVQGLEAFRAVGTRSLDEFVSKFETGPRVMWVMVPAGKPTSETIAALVERGERGDIIIDGGSTSWKVALEDAVRIKARGLHHIDAGTSGGIWGLEILALYERLLGRLEDTFTDKMLAMMRNQFGGHALVAEQPVAAGRP